MKNQRIIANAGSGKTYRLVTRYLELLRLEVPAEKIIALTFTRKAAGEFLDRIFGRLLDGMESGDRETGLTSQECTVLLRQLVNKLPKLTLGTLDSFFGRMVRAFPFECGIAGEISIMDGHALNQARREALEALFREHTDEESFAAFLDLIRQQNRNSEGRDVTETLGQQIDALHEGFLMTPPLVTWGDASTIWPQGCEFLGDENLADLALTFERELCESHPDMPVEYRDRWNVLCGDLQGLRKGSVVNAASIRFALRAVDPPVVPKDPGSFYLTVHGNKRFAFAARQRPLVMALGRAILKLELEGRLSRSNALYDLVSRFERPYQTLVRDSGRLTFADITGLLAAAEGGGWGGAGAPTINRQEMDFRLDATYDHWLLDEFQDTSRLQWQALRNLVDEVVQSESGRRSFFYVGDTKQAIYTWRGGDPRLFDEVADYYNSSGTNRIDTSEALDISRRSVPEVLEAVNRIFDPVHLARLKETMGFPDETLRRWESAWREHKPHDPARNGGVVVWKTLEAGDEGRRELLDAETARLIAEIDPLSKGLSCAVLVKSNSRAALIVDAIRAAGVDARSEGRFNPCNDNELGSALISLLSAVAHPDDATSRQHVKMTPLSALGGGDFSAFRIEALRLLRDEGFAAAIEKWSAAFLPEDNAFLEGRAADFRQAAEDFDAGYPGGSIDEFMEFLENRTSSDDPAAGVVRVLTVHASKGLDFDMVVLPDVESDVLASRRDDAPVFLHQDREGRIDWGLDLPPKDVCRADPVLQAAYLDALSEDCYENLCLYYVAATRAKRALYILSSSLRESTTSRNFNRLLHETFTREDNASISGNPDWYQSVRPAQTESVSLEVIPMAGGEHRELRPESPSLKSPGGSALDPSRVFTGPDVLALGTEMHRALATMEWSDGERPDFGSLSGEAAEILNTFFDSETARRTYSRPDLSTRVWREKAFDVFVDGTWVSGVFDRVVLYDNRAEIYDFKTEGHDLAAAYGEQMKLYRKSLAVLTGLPENSISATLIGLRTGDAVSV